MKKLLVFLLTASILLTLVACSGGSDKAKSALESYLQCIVDKDYETAYGYLCDFDKDNISKELFIRWRTTTAKVQATKGFSIPGKVDKFKNYKYLGSALGDAFGFEVKQEVEKIIPGIDLQGYDSDTYHIMVVKDGEECKVALLLTDLDEQVKKLEAAIDEKGKAAK